ncbi:MAG: DNA repair protein RecO [Caldimicrobium sp.]
MLFSLPALVLDKEVRNEIDLLVIFLTPGGKIRALAKGAQKSRRRFLNLLEDLTYLKVHLRKPQKGKILILEGADLLYLPESLRWMPSKFYFFSYVSEILDFTSPEALKKSDFEWLINFIKFLDKKEPFNLNEAKIFFELKWLQICGLYPQVWECVSCGREPKRIYYFSVPSGGILCFSCKDSASYSLSLNQIDLLRKIVRIKELNEVETLMKGLSTTENSLLIRLVEEFFAYHFDWEPRSLRILKEEFLSG